MLRQWIVSQIGAREHYAVARAFEAAGSLDLLVTDYWCRRGRALLGAGPAPLRALAGRWDSRVPCRKVVSFNCTTLLDRLRSLGVKEQGEQMSREYVRLGKAFGRATERALRRRALSRDRHGFFAYCTGALEPVELLASRRILTVVDQIDAARTHVETIRSEQEKWPGWETRIGDVSDEYWQRLQAEWRAASIVLVNSSWSRAALIGQGVPAEKLIVVPLAFEGERRTARPAGRTGRLRVLSLGSVTLGKGIHYLIEAAKLLLQEDIAITIAGPIGITADAIASAPANVDFPGRITRDRVGAFYDAADLFVFPTLSDGFGITQLEAMAHGLPVIATPRCGEVVEDGRSGFIVPPGDAKALAEAILRLARDRRLLAEMSMQALRRVRVFSLASFVGQLNSELRRVGVALD